MSDFALFRYFPERRIFVNEKPLGYYCREGFHINDFLQKEVLINEETNKRTKDGINHSS